ncbi:hypothetical protein GO491_07780 [Flavobacteriaceae bacterium Ap0902]|nr:hypothetical protein [Flavobacteriaceae bacterium Ap0902]
MKHYITFLLLSLALFQLQGQKHEVGVFLGSSNGITDIGGTEYVRPFPKEDGTTEFPALPINVGLLYRFNLNPQQSLRFNLHHTFFNDHDGIAKEEYRRRRWVRYGQRVSEASIVFEYNFFPINSIQRRAHSPYIFAGFGAFAFNKPKYTAVHVVNEPNKSGDIINPTNLGDTFSTSLIKDNELEFSYTIPFGAGYKYKFSYNWIASIELGFRPTFIDNLDMADVSINNFEFRTAPDFYDSYDESIYGDVAEAIREREIELINERNIGDHSNHDWYVFTGVTLTYTFGRPPCFCD